MTGNPAAPILCCECGDCFVDREGDACSECLEFIDRWFDLGWHDGPSAYDRLRDRDEEDRCYAN